MRGLDKVLLYMNTIRYLKAVQIRHQMSNRLSGSRRKQKLLCQIRELQAPAFTPGNLLIPILDFDEAYLARFCVGDLLKNEIQILHEKHKINLTKWEVKEASHLWNYNLQYLEFLIPLAAACRNDHTGQYFQKWCEYVNSWMEYPAGDSYEPYTISMRIPNLLICMNILGEKIRGSELEEKLMNSIFRQYQYLLATQELALLANHYFENLKTILICCILFGEEENYRKYFDKFCEQIVEQILPDGLHYERSFMYHKIILEDILRVYKVLGDRPDAGELKPVIENMADALASVSYGFQKTPLFNDAGDNVAKDTNVLLRAVQEETGYRASDGQETFEASGYYKLYAGENVLLFDCGPIGPSYMGGHGHCDCLSFELARSGKLLFTNSGTYQYQGRLRKFFRSTPAHNTIMIDKREQAELWGEHRAARRLSGIEHRIGNQSVSGKFQSFQGDCFIRNIRLTEKYVAFTDRVIANDGEEHCARQFFHLASDCRFAEDTGLQVFIWNKEEKQAVIDIPAGSDWLIHRDGDICSLAQDFGELKHKEVLEIRTPFVKRTEVSILIELL